MQDQTTIGIDPAGDQPPACLVCGAEAFPGQAFGVACWMTVHKDDCRDLDPGDGD